MGIIDKAWEEVHKILKQQAKKSPHPHNGGCG
jgi:hypothetical protein